MERYLYRLHFGQSSCLRSAWNRLCYHRPRHDDAATKWTNHVARRSLAAGESSRQSCISSRGSNVRWHAGTHSAPQRTHTANGERAQRERGRRIMGARRLRGPRASEALLRLRGGDVLVRSAPARYVGRFESASGPRAPRASLQQPAWPAFLLDARLAFFLTHAHGAAAPASQSMIYRATAGLR